MEMITFVLMLVASAGSVSLAQGSDPLSWTHADNEDALCNDFTRAGFFHRQSKHNDKWVVFLESGSLCYSSETCNRRYFNRPVRDRYRTDVRGKSLFGNFDTELAWSETGAAGQPLTQVVNPLMTSVYCFRNETQFFSESKPLSVEGRDILSSNCRENPTFCNHSHVLVPYCSSDLWLGSDSRENKSCDCWDQECFPYNPTSQDLQFTFRGQTIFHSVLQTMERLYNLQTASEIVLVGSSAGGIGVLNSAKWVKENFPNVYLKVIIDSSWFINFRGSIVTEFGSVSEGKGSSSTSKFSELLKILDGHQTCMDTRLGYPCCISAQCLLQERSLASGEPYFPPDVPVFALTSLYDVFLLANSLAGLIPVSGDFNPGLALQFITTVGEYGGAMNETIIDTTDIAVQTNISFSYFATQCFQHIYFSPSSLRDPEGLLGDDGIEIKEDPVMFEHTIASGVWNKQLLLRSNDDTNITNITTVQEAIGYWYGRSPEDYGVGFRDLCSGPHCSSLCPERIIVSGEEEFEVWSVGVRAAIAGVVLLIGVVCLTLKMYCCLWLKLLHKKQQNFLLSTKSQLDEETAETPTLIREFPNCVDTNAISVACLDLHYSVTIDRKAQRKAEKKETRVQPVALSELQDNEDLCENIDDGGTLYDREAYEEQSNKGYRKTKRILNGISAYFNPGELIAIMGPSGCGKTTFLDLLTGRRKTGNTQGSIFVNGSPMEKNRNWYVSNTGYVLQLAAPYYEELTVRENLTLAAWVKLHISSREKFQRVEQVMEVSGLTDLADTVVGGATGPGLSGGQKRRLVVALQLLKLPSVIFLDEPTSGLDSASSTELLTHLNSLAASNRTVVLTIHQPRLEIFHMFHRIVVLTDGKVAYHGVPEKAYEVFVDALQSAFLSQRAKIPAVEDHNPADIIMDMLGNRKMRKIVNRYYEDSGEPRLVRKAIDEAWCKEQNFNGDEIDGKRNLSTMFKTLRVMFRGSRHAGRTQNYLTARLAALEARAMKRANAVVLLYLPIIFFGYGFLLGTVYFQTTEPFLVMSGFCVYSVASALFMFPALYTFYTPALEMYRFERADGAGRATDLVIQPFVRFISMAFFPVLICAGVLYVLLVDYRRYNLIDFLQIALVNLALNQTWTSLLIWLILAFPKKAFRLSPVISALAGFTSGFFIPIKNIPWWYRWMSFINPNYYGFSASAVLLVSDFESDCEREGGSELECYTSSGDYILKLFGFQDINPYQNIVILLGMTVFFLLLAGICNWTRYQKMEVVIKRIKLMLSNSGMRKSPVVCDQTPLTEEERHTPSDSEAECLTEDEYEDEQEGATMETCKDKPATSETCEEAPSEAKQKWMRLLQRYKEENECRISPERDTPSPNPLLRSASRIKSLKNKRDTRRKALYLVAGQSHSVWKPGKSSVKKMRALPDVVIEVVRNKQDLKERQKRLRSRVMATQLVLKVQREEFDDTAGEEEEVQTPRTEKRMWKKVIQKVMDENCKTKGKGQKRSKRSFHFQEIVSQYAEKMAKADQDQEATQNTALQAKTEARRALRQWKSQHNIGQTKSSTKKKTLKPYLSSLSQFAIQAESTTLNTCDTIAEEDDSTSL